MTINALLCRTVTAGSPGSDPSRVTNALASTIESYIRDELLARETGLWL